MRTTFAAAVLFASMAVHAVAATQLLVAANTEDPDFAQAVVLLLESDNRGAIGLIINVRTDVQVGELFPDLKRTNAGSALLYKGGPLRQGINGLLRSRTKPVGASSLFGDVYILSDKAALKNRAASVPSTAFRIYIGSCGWSAGQLHNEILSGVWRSLPTDANLIFDPHPDTLWNRLSAKLRAQPVSQSR